MPRDLFAFERASAATPAAAPVARTIAGNSIVFIVDRDVLNPAVVVTNPAVAVSNPATVVSNPETVV